MEGHDVTVVSDGAGALRAIENGIPDVVLLDIGMLENGSRDSGSVQHYREKMLYES